jgi:NADP-dependent 3-hydroxy acid dehydrogenase YdfG
MADEVVVITGASAGIGAALAERLAKDGASVVLVARRSEALDAVRGRCGDRALAVTADVTRPPDMTRVAEAAIARFGHIDAWVNNAGRGITRLPSELTDADIDEMMLVNVKSVVYAVSAVLPHFKARGRGHIVNVSSVLGRRPWALFRSAYSGAKHFLNAYSAMLRDELRESHPGIQVSLVSPGVVATEFGINAVHGGPDSRTFEGAQTADEVAAVIAGVIRTRAADVYTRPESRQAVLDYLAELGQNPA